MYRSSLVPRGMAMLGLIGGPLIIVSGTAVLFSVLRAHQPQVLRVDDREPVGWGTREG
jgi:hypothetical protein